MLPSIYYPNKPLTIGLLGGGQLAKMLASAAYRMGLRVAVIENGADSPAGIMTKLEFPNGWNSDDLAKFIGVSDIITLENEFIDPHILDEIAEKRLVFPAPNTMRLVQDKFTQKMTMLSCGIPVTAFEKFDIVQNAIDFGEKHGFPYVMKTRKYGYDGYGNATIRSKFDAEAAFRRFTESDAPRELMGEKFVDFAKELAVIVARNRRGETAVYPCVETIQENHICRFVIAPVPISAELQAEAQEIALKAVEAIEGVGIFGVELFLTNDNRILFNEIAPRPHNSGHYTIEGCVTSQFENCIRAVCNLPLGSTELIAPAAVMMNLLGERSGPGVPDTVVGLLRHDRVSLHLYGKKESRKGRKMGHLTALGNSQEEAFERVKLAEKDLIW